MRLKALIKELKKYSKENKGDPIVTFGESPIMDGMIFLKEHSDLFLADLTVEETIIGKYVRHKKSDDGKYLVIDLRESKPFTPDDFEV